MLRRVLSQPGHGKSSFCLDLNWTRLQETETSPRFNTSEMFYEISCFVKFCCVFCKAMFYKMCFLNLCCVLWYVFCDMLLYCLELCVFCNGVMFSKMSWFLKGCVLGSDIVFYEMSPCFLKYSHVSTIRPPHIQHITIQATFPQAAFKVVISWTIAAELIPFLFVFI